MLTFTKLKTTTRPGLISRNREGLFLASPKRQMESSLESDSFQWRCLGRLGSTAFYTKVILPQFHDILMNVSTTLLVGRHVPYHCSVYLHENWFFTNGFLAFK